MSPESTRPPRLAIVAAMKEELAALRQRVEPEPVFEAIGKHALPLGMGPVMFGRLVDTPVVLATVGDGRARAMAGLTMLLRHVPVNRVLVVGFAGSLSPQLRRAELVVADRVGAARAAWFDGVTPPALGEGLAGVRLGDVFSVPALLLASEAKAKLAAELASSRPLVVDLESHALVRILISRGIPWRVLRAVSDLHDETLPSVLAEATGEDGAISRARLLLAAVRRPKQLISLLNMKRAADGCAASLADACFQAASGLTPLFPSETTPVLDPGNDHAQRQHPGPNGDAKRRLEVL